MTTLAQDTFARSNQSGLGTASDGHVWSSDLSGQTSSIVSNQGNIRANSGGDEAWQLGSGTATTVNISCRMKVPGGATGPFVRGNVNGGFPNGYQFLIYGSSLLFVVESSGTHNVLQNVTIPGFDNTKFWWVRGVVSGTTYQGRAWQDGTTEPSTWLYTGTDSTYSSGGYGLATNDTSTGIVDNFVVTDNQSNPTTVTKSLPLRTLIRTQKTVSTGLRTLIRTQKTVSTAARMLVRTAKTVSTPLRTNIRTQVTRALSVRAVVRTQKTVSTSFRTLVRTGRTLSSPLRSRVGTQRIQTTILRSLVRSQVTKSQAVRTGIRTQQTKSVPVRTVVRGITRVTALRVVVLASTRNVYSTAVVTGRDGNALVTGRDGTSIMKGA